MLYGYDDDDDDARRQQRVGESLANRSIHTCHTDFLTYP